MANDYDSILGKVSSILSEKIVTDTGKEGAIKAETPLLSSGLNLDSVAVLELVVEVENQFGVTFEDEDLSVELFSSVGSLASAVEKKLSGSQVAASDNAS